MSSLRSLVAPLCALLVACSPATLASPDDASAAPDVASSQPDSGPDAAAPDARAPATDAATPDARVESAPVIPSFSHGTAPGLCLPDPAALGTFATQAPPTRGFVRFVTRAVMADDRASPSYSDGFNGDATINLVTPRGGRWRITARGENLGLLHAFRGCAGSPTTAHAQLNGDGVINELELDLDSQRDERWFLTVDGCAAGRRCPVEIVAERIAPLSGCAVGVCETSEQCALDPRDDERFLCSRGPTRDELSSATVRDLVFARDTSGNAIITGSLTGPAREWNTTIPVYFVLSPPGFNRTGHHSGEVTVRNGRIVASPQTQIPLESTLVRFWLIGSDQARWGFNPPPVADATTSVTLWQRRAEGQSCDERDLATLCALGHVCRDGACRRAASVALDRLVAYRDGARNELRARVEGTRAGNEAVALDWQWLDASGAVSHQRRNGASSSPRWVVREESSFDAQWFEQTPDAVVPSLRALRVSADPAVSLTVAIQPTIVAGPAQACDSLSRSCSAGLVCERGACIPAAVPACERPSLASQWAPSDAGEHVVWSSQRPMRESTAPSCGSITHGNASITTDFVAPVTGEYTIDASSLPSEGSPVILEALQGCRSESCVDSTAPSITRRLWAGQRLRLRAWFSSRYQGAQLRARLAPSAM